MAHVELSTGGVVPIDVEIVRDIESHLRGLSGVDDLRDEVGMLFVFEQEDLYPFWMKDVLLSLDLLFADLRGRIVTVYRDVLPQTERIYRPSSPSGLVLEVRAGFLARHGIQVGDHLTWKPIPLQERP